MILVGRERYSIVLIPRRINSAKGWRMEKAASIHFCIDRIKRAECTTMKIDTFEGKVQITDHHVICP